MAGPTLLGMIEAALGASATREIAISAASVGITSWAFDDDEIAPALEVINNTLNSIDQAIVAGFAGRDIQLTRLDAALATANGRLDATREQIERIEPFKDATQREGSSLRVQWRELAEEEARLFDQVTALHQARTGRLDELNGADASGRSLSGTDCCCPHEQVMGAVNKAMPVAPGLGLSSGSDSKLTGLEDSVNKGKLAIDGLISSEAKANLDEFSAKFTGIFEKASRDGKITAGEIGNSFKQMAMDILQNQVISKLFAGKGPLGAVAGNLLGGLLGGRAGGGNVEPNIPVLVGERGPELLVPRSPGRIVNNHNSRSMAKSQPVVIHQTINIEPTTQKDLVAMIHASRPALREDAKRAVFEAMNHIRY